jgi:cyclin B
LSNYILDESTLSIELIKFMPSQLAAASVFIARKAMGRNAWSPTLLKYSKYREEEIIPVATAMMQAKNNLSSSLTAIKKRYNSRKKEHVAKIPLSSTF